MPCDSSHPWYPRLKCFFLRGHAGDCSAIFRVSPTDWGVQVWWFQNRHGRESASISSGEGGTLST